MQVIHHEECMGTVFSFMLRTELSDVDAAAALASAIKELHAADEMFSLYKPESPLSRLGRGEVSVAELDPLVDEVWNACEAWNKTTEGWFSAFTPQNTFDPSGLVKTWAVQRAVQHLIEAGIEDFTVNAGGDILVGDKASDAVDWRVGISKPVSIASEDAGVLTVFDLKGTGFTAVATSGSTERGDHIWNPKAAGRVQNELAQVTVIAKNLVTADVWATAAFAEGPRSIERLDKVEGVEAFYVFNTPDETGFPRLAATRGIHSLFAKAD